MWSATRVPCTAPHVLATPIKAFLIISDFPLALSRHIAPSFNTQTNFPTTCRSHCIQIPYLNRSQCAAACLARSNCTAFVHAKQYATQPSSPWLCTGLLAPGVSKTTTTPSASYVRVNAVSFLLCLALRYGSNDAYLVYFHYCTHFPLSRVSHARPPWARSLCGTSTH